MPRLHLYPVGNADTTVVELDNDRVIIFDYSHTKDSEDENDKKIDLKKELTEFLDSKNLKEIDVAVFTHADLDHIRGSDNFFYFEHAKQYQDEHRIKIKEIWVPASFIVEENLTGEARIIRQEARHRLKENSGIRVFSNPIFLKTWFEDNDIDPKSREHLISDAGSVVPGFNLQNDKVEFFPHSPFAHKVGEDLESRNEGSLVLHLTFEVDGRKTRVMMAADTTYNRLQDIIRISKYHNNDARLETDIYHISHHCSYTALEEEKSKEKCSPPDDIDDHFRNGSNSGCILVSPSKVIEDEVSVQPPHIQAARYYREVASNNRGEFLVTMEFPSKKKPDVMVIDITGQGGKVRKSIISGAMTAAGSASPRMGNG